MKEQKIKHRIIQVENLYWFTCIICWEQNDVVVKGNQNHQPIKGWVQYQTENQSKKIKPLIQLVWIPSRRLIMLLSSVYGSYLPTLPITSGHYESAGGVLWDLLLDLGQAVSSGSSLCGALGELPYIPHLRAPQTTESGSEVFLCMHGGCRLYRELHHWAFLFYCYFSSLNVFQSRL